MLIRRGVRALGYDFYPLRKGLGWGHDPWRDMQRVYSSAHRPTVFDVGANVGQTVILCEKFLGAVPICCFEPDTDAFTRLSARVGTRSHVRLFNLALGPQNGRAVLKRQASSAMTSLLEPGAGWGEVQSMDEVELRTIDSICDEIDVHRIDLLKIDAQGYDLEVVRGSVKMIKSGEIRFVLMEVNLVPMYQGQAEWDSIYRTMVDLGMRVQAVYPLVYVEDRPTYMDVLFENTNFQSTK